MDGDEDPCAQLIEATRARRRGTSGPTLRSALAACRNARVVPAQCVDRTGRDALALAAARGSPSDVRTLLANGFNPNAEDNHGIRPLSIAAQRGHPAIVSLLSKAGAETAAVDVFGLAALHKAAAFGHAAVAKTLLNAGADPNAPTAHVTAAQHLQSEGSRGLPPLHLTVRASAGAPTANKCDTAATLLAGGADVNGRDNAGNTPLHACCGGSSGGGASAPSCDWRVALLLLREGADPHAVDRAGQRPGSAVAFTSSPLCWLTLAFASRNAHPGQRQ